jgi:cytochrome c-type biogenesis protein CcmH/NrfG
MAEPVRDKARETTPQRDPVVYFAAGVLFGAILGFGLAKLGGGSDAPRPVAVAPGGGPPAGAAAAGAAAPHAAAPGPVDPNEVRVLEAQAERDKSDVRVRVALGNVYMDHQRWTEATRWYEEALALQPQQPDVIVDLGACLVGLGRTDDAVRRFDAALKIDANHKKAMFNKGVALLQAGRNKEAVAQWEDLLKRFPGDPLFANLRQQIDQVKASQAP